MSFEFKPEYYRAKVAKEEAIQAELIHGGITHEAVFGFEMRMKWEHLCLEQQSILPEIQIPKQWELRLLQENEHTFSFLDCSHVMSIEHAEIKNIIPLAFLDCSREILQEAI